MPSPIAYVREYEARSRIGYVSNMVHPSRHPDLRVRAHYWAGEVRKASAELAGLGRDPSHEADIASDRLDECLTAFRETVTDWRTSHRLDAKSEPRFNTYDARDAHAAYTAAAIQHFGEFARTE